ncbi:NUDIX hydrolase [Kordiimonas gwangyangensis]|nr:NUDIX hydrolase [Kordiimonas gwangyangensis]
MSDDVTFLHRRELYSDPFLKVAERQYSHRDRDYRYFIKEEPEFAVCGAVTMEGEVLMVRQFRPGPGRWLYDMPGGMVDEGDTPLETARKELLEETGYMAEIKPLGTSYVTAYSTAKKHIFLATNCRKVAEPEDDPHIIGEPVLISRKALKGIIASGELLDLDCA